MNREEFNQEIDRWILLSGFTLVAVSVLASFLSPGQLFMDRLALTIGMFVGIVVVAIVKSHEE